LRALIGSAALALTVAGCETTAQVTATNPHPDLPANYRRMVVDYMKTQMFVEIGGDRLRAQAVEISDPHRNFYGYDVVCVRFGGGGYPNFSTVRGYAFSGGQLLTWTGNIISQYGSGVLVMAAWCGDQPVFRPFPEWNSAR
jgi:hypothetical protein